MGFFFLFVSLFLGIWFFVTNLLSFLSGWRKLAAKYRAAGEVPGTVSKFQTGAIGLTSYKNCLNLTISEEGLGLGILPIFRPGHPDLFIPWAAIGPTRVDKIGWMEMVIFEVEGVKVRLANKAFSGRSFS